MNNQRGVSMLEVMVASALLGFAGIAILGALATSFRAQDLNRQGVIVENLAQNALEEVRGSIPQYQTFYVLELFVPQGYSVSVETVSICPEDPDSEVVVFITDCLEDEMQSNTVTVGREGRTLIVLEDLKTRR